MPRIACRLVATAAVLAAASASWAAPYTGNGPGQSTIRAGGGGDYVSLAAAVAAINAAPLTGGDWTFLIATDLVETSKIALGQNTNGNALVFRPAPATQPTVTFATTESTTLGWGGHWIIGTATKNSHLANIDTHNVIIDGSNNGTGSRDLTFANSGANMGTIIDVVGNSDGFEIRNCVVATGAAAGSGGSCLRLAGIDIAPFVDDTPDDAMIENCEFTGYLGLVLNRNGASGATPGSAGTAIRNSDFQSGQHCVLATEYRTIEVSGNRMEVDSPLTTGNAAAISISGGTTEDVQMSVMIEGNEIAGVRRALDSAANIYGVFVGGSAGTGAPLPTIRIVNNAVAEVGPNAAGAAAANIVAGVRVDAADSGVEIWFNSISVSVGSDYTLGSPTYSGGIVINNTTAASNVDMRNNIVHYMAPAGFALSRSSNQGSWTSDFNSWWSEPFFADPGDSKFNDAGTTRTPLADWRAATGLDVSSVVLDPLEPAIAGRSVPRATAPFWWMNREDLRFFAYAWYGHAGVPIAGVPTDLDGVTRNAVIPCMGAFEPAQGYLSSAVEGWQGFD